RKQYLGQVVIVKSPVIELRGQNYCLFWNVAVETGNRYKAGVLDHLPYSYQGKTAKVIAVQLNELKVKPQTNAFGEPVNQENISNPYTDVVVEFGDGQVALTTNYPALLEESVELESKQQAEEDEITAGLPQL